MRKVIIGVVIGCISLFVIVGFTVVQSGLWFYNDAIKQEKGIEAQYQQNQNNYDNFVKKIQEASQVPSMYTDDIRKVYSAVVTGRYGASGSKAMLQFIREQNPSMDAALYKQIQQLVEAGRDSFETNQTMLLDKKRVYQVTLGQFPNNLLAKFFGFPKINLDKYDIVTSDETSDAFSTKKSKAIKLR